MKRQSNMLPNVIKYVFDQNQTYIEINVNTKHNYGDMETFKKLKTGVVASRELLKALNVISDQCEVLYLSSIPERNINIKEYMKKYNITKPRELRQHQQENLNKYYKKLGFSLIDDDTRRNFVGKIDHLIKTIKEL